MFLAAPLNFQLRLDHAPQQAAAGANVAHHGLLLDSVVLQPWLDLRHGSPAERKTAMVIGWPLLKLNASTRGPRS
jgi:hypothetical protein